MTRYIVLAVALAACGGDDGMQMPDAKMADAAPMNNVVDVTCPATPDATVMALSGSYSPMNSTIGSNGIVKFVTTIDHNVEPNPLTTTDPGLRVGFNQTKCLQFKATGVFGFKCGPHAFVGTVTVN